jgi:hypothetical protein
VLLEAVRMFVKSVRAHVKPIRVLVEANRVLVQPVRVPVEAWRLLQRREIGGSTPFLRAIFNASAPHRTSPSLSIMLC